MTALLEIDALEKRFGGVTAVDGCSFAVAPRTITGLIGPNGSGKTTVFNLVTGYLAADAGSVRFDGRPVRRPDPTRLARRGLLRTFQQARIFPHLTAVEHLALAAPHPWWSSGRARVSGEERTRAVELLEQLGLARYADTEAAELSYGQRKLLEFASTLMSRPRIVLLDEPMAGVNPVMIQELERHVREQHAHGLTFLIVEHNMSLVMRLCDPVIVLDHGTKLAEGRPAEIQSDPRVLDAYLGT